MVSNIYREAVEAFGDQHQIVKAMEELGELISALARYTATSEGSLRLRALYADHVSEEMADVEIMLAELKVIFGNASDVLLWKNRKRERLAERIRNARAKG